MAIDQEYLRRYAFLINQPITSITDNDLSGLFIDELRMLCKFKEVALPNEANEHEMVRLFGAVRAKALDATHTAQQQQDQQPNPASKPLPTDEPHDNTDDGAQNINSSAPNNPVDLTALLTKIETTVNSIGSTVDSAVNEALDKKLSVLNNTCGGWSKKRPRSTTLANKSPKKAKQTRLTNQKKIEILNELDEKGGTIKSICDKYDLHRNTVSQWKKERDKIRQQVEEEGRAEKKRARTEDGLNRIRMGMKDFYIENMSLPNELRVPLTRRILAAKAIVIRDTLLQQHKNDGMLLTEVEIKALSTFKASESWAGKFARESGWRSEILLEDFCDGRG